jgi:TPR repeat protein
MSVSNRSIFTELFRGKPTLERAEHAFARGRAADAAVILRQLADQGDPQAQLRLAQLLESGDGVPKNIVEAEHWYRIAAEQDSVAAQAWLGEIYLTGAAAPAFTQDLEKAADWNHRAARAGDPAAQARLAHQYASGLGLKRDLAAAEHWFEAAASAPAGPDQLAGMLGLGLLHAGAYGQARDHAQALEWFERAAAQNDSTAALCLALLLLYGDGIAHDEVRALALLEDAAVAGQPAAMFHTAELYGRGRFAEDRAARAANWRRRAAAAGYLARSESAAPELGLDQRPDLRHELQSAADWFHRVRARGPEQTPYHQDTLQLGGPGRPRDPKAARAWYRRVAEQGSGAACMELANIYATGNAVEKNDTTAARWYAQAAVQGVEEGRYQLALLHLYGRGVAQNKPRAIALLTQAAEGDHVASAWALYRLYAEGKDIEADATRAAYFLARAAECGSGRGSEPVAAEAVTAKSVKAESTTARPRYILGSGVRIR